MTEKKAIRVLKITEYKDFHILIQQVIKTHMFQFIIFDPKEMKFYQSFSIFTPKGGKNKQHIDSDVVALVGLMLDFAFTTVDTLLARDNPDGLIEENAKGAGVLEILENANKEEKIPLPLTYRKN